MAQETLYTRFALYPRKGWLSMECNVEADQSLREQESRQEFAETDSVWVPNDLAAKAQALEKEREGLVKVISALLEIGDRGHNFAIAETSPDYDGFPVRDARKLTEGGDADTS